MFLNMFENPVNIEVAFNQCLFYSDNWKRHLKSSPRIFWTDLVKQVFSWWDSLCLKAAREISLYWLCHPREIKSLLLLSLCLVYISKVGNGFKLMLSCHMMDHNIFYKDFIYWKSIFARIYVYILHLVE